MPQNYTHIYAKYRHIHVYYLQRHIKNLLQMKGLWKAAIIKKTLVMLFIR